MSLKRNKTKKYFLPADLEPLSSLDLSALWGSSGWVPGLALLSALQPATPQPPPPRAAGAVESSLSRRSWCLMGSSAQPKPLRTPPLLYLRLSRGQSSPLGRWGSSARKKNNRPMLWPAIVARLFSAFFLSQADQKLRRMLSLPCPRLAAPVGRLGPCSRIFGARWIHCDTWPPGEDTVEACCGPHLDACDDWEEGPD